MNKKEIQIKKKDIQGHIEQSLQEGKDGSEKHIMSSYSKNTVKPDFEYSKILIKKTKGKKILDIGSGICWVAANLIKDGYDVVSTDFNTNKICGLNAARVYENKFKKDIKRVACDVEHLPFKDDTFDVIFGREILHHCVNMDKLLKESYRVLKKGGQAIISKEHSTIPLLDGKTFLKIFMHHKGLKYGRNENPRRINQYKKEFLKAGFSGISISPFDGWEGFFKRITKKKQEPILTKVFKRLVSSTTNILGENNTKMIISNIGGFTITITGKKN